MPMKVTFTCHRGSRDQVQVIRRDGTFLAWDFPSHDARLPHDLCHLVVEQELGLANGFWGLVDQGVDVQVTDDRADLLLDGRPLRECPGADFSGLMQAEEAVALLSPTGMQTEQTGSLIVARLGTSPATPEPAGIEPPELGFTLPPTATANAVASIRRRLFDLGREWHTLADGDSITLTYGTAAPGYR
jgi:hypothetical protein